MSVLQAQALLSVWKKLIRISEYEQTCFYDLVFKLKAFPQVLLKKQMALVNMECIRVCVKIE